MEQQTQRQVEDADPVDRKFNEECLEAHNIYRDLHGCPPLVFSTKLARRAQQWAEHLASLGYLKHSPNAAGNFGENVAMKMALGSREYRGSQAAAQWYSEIEMYDFDGVENQSRCGHFSQLVWKSTRKAGFGKAVSAVDGKMFAVGQYTPPGNMMNCWVANIPAPLSGQIKVPSYQDIMGEDVERAATKKLDSNMSLVEDSNPAGHLLLTASQEFGDLSRLEPKPKDQQDKQIGKSTKTRIINGEKSLIITMTFMRPDGTRYQLSNEVSVHDSSEFVPGIHHHHHQEVYEDEDEKGDGKCNGFKPSQFAAEMLLAHNSLRERHGAPELHRSESLEHLAQAWAEQLLSSFDGNGGLRRCDLPEAHCLGQSVAGRSGNWKPVQPLPRGLGPAAQLARQWYGEMKGFEFGREGVGLELGGGHFSQMVWRATKKLGVGCAVDTTTGNVCVVCLYHPCGNVVGKFTDNVFPPFM